MKKFWLGFLAGIVFSIVSVFIMAVVVPMIQMNNYKYQPQQNISAPIELPSKGVVNFQEITDESKPIITLFYVDWCGYCRRFMPIFGQYAQKYNKDFSFAYINCDNPDNIKIVHKNKIRSFPTLKIVDKQLDTVTPINIAATQSEEIFNLELQKHMKLREKLNK